MYHTMTHTYKASMASNNRLFIFAFVSYIEGKSGVNVGHKIGFRLLFISLTS